MPTLSNAIMDPVHVKTTVGICPVVQWRGGQLMELWKAKGNPACIKSYRDVACCDYTAKVAGKHQRANWMSSVA